MYSEHCETFKMERFAKGIMSECRCATRNFLGQLRGRFVELGHFDKEALQANILKLFLLDTVINCEWKI